MAKLIITRLDDENSDLLAGADTKKNVEVLSIIAVNNSDNEDVRVTIHFIGADGLDPEEADDDDEREHLVSAENVIAVFSLKPGEKGKTDFSFGSAGGLKVSTKNNKNKDGLFARVDNPDNVTVTIVYKE